MYVYVDCICPITYLPANVKHEIELGFNCNVGCRGGVGGRLYWGTPMQADGNNYMYLKVPYKCHEVPFLTFCAFFFLLEFTLVTKNIASIWNLQRGLCKHHLNICVWTSGFAFLCPSRFLVRLICKCVCLCLICVHPCLCFFFVSQVFSVWLVRSRPSCRVPLSVLNTSLWCHCFSVF